ncbi:protein YOP1 [Yarrowia lipolytica]|nr:protein YOP1 [Yarrowia lipolytica]
MSQIIDQVQAALQNIDKELEKYPALKELEKQIPVPKSYILLGFVGFYFILIFLNIGGIGQLLSNIAGLVIPGYYCLLALETPGKADDTQYLTYWVVFATLNVFEFWSKAILYWVPFYYLFKTAFLLYIGLPQYGGAELVYKAIVKPLAQKLVNIQPHGGPSDSLKAQAQSAVGAAESHVPQGHSTGVSH